MLDSRVEIDAASVALRDDARVARATRRVGIVTGASREIGAEMAVALAGTGVAIVVAHSGEPDLADSVVTVGKRRAIRLHAPH